MAAQGIAASWKANGKVVKGIGAEGVAPMRKQ